MWREAIFSSTPQLGKLTSCFTIANYIAFQFWVASLLLWNIIEDILVDVVE